MKKDDPAVDEIRAVRHRISESVAHDPRKLVDYYRKLQERHRERLLSEPTGSKEEKVEHAA
jgi:hypothetical protein